MADDGAFLVKRPRVQKGTGAFYSCNKGHKSAFIDQKLFMSNAVSSASFGGSTERMNIPIEKVGDFGGAKIQLIQDMASAGGLVARTMAAEAGSDHHAMEVSNNKVGMLIGKGGKTIKDIQTRTGARIQVMPLNSTSERRLICLKGTSEQVDAAIQLVSKVTSIDCVVRYRLPGGYQTPQPTNWNTPSAYVLPAGYPNPTAQFNMSQGLYSTAQQTTQGSGYPQHISQQQPSNNAGYNYTLQQLGHGYSQDGYTVRGTYYATYDQQKLAYMASYKHMTNTKEVQGYSQAGCLSQPPSQVANHQGYSQAGYWSQPPSQVANHQGYSQAGYWSQPPSQAANHHGYSLAGSCSQPPALPGYGASDGAPQSQSEYVPLAYRSYPYHQVPFHARNDESKYCGLRGYNDIIECLIKWTGTDYLIGSNKQKVNIHESLRGKTVGLFFMSLAPHQHECILNLATLYRELARSNKGCFEIVFIAQGESSDLFYEYLEMMPWLAVPFIDSEARNQLYNLAEIKAPYKYEVLIFDCHGKLLVDDAYSWLKFYGADLYPFTYKKFKEIEDEDYATTANKSLKNLLANPTRDFVMANDGTHVSISCLEDMVVGIYFCGANDLDSDSDFTRKLVHVYEQLNQKRMRFQIVVVYDERIGWCGEEDFTRKLEKLPWLALPYMDTNCKRLFRLFPGVQFEMDHKLVIIGPGGSFVNCCGYAVVKSYGTEAYPFSRLSAAEIEKKKLEEVRLEHIWTCDDLDYVMSASGEKIKTSELRGKTILLLIIIGEELHLMEELLEMYHAIKMIDADFEVVVAHEDFSKDLFDDYHLPMQWFALPYKETRRDSLCKLSMNCRISTSSVFGPDGRLLSVATVYDFYVGLLYRDDAYPFSSNGLLMDMYRVLADRHSWPQELDDKSWQPDVC